MESSLVFNSFSKSSMDVNQSWNTSNGDLNVQTDIPKEFSGQGLGFSPEDYFAFALQNCYIATFKVIASKSKLAYQNIEVKFSLRLDRESEADPSIVMKEAFFDVTLAGAENPERAQRILEKTVKACMILNSVKTNLHFTFNQI